MTPPHSNASNVSTMKATSSALCRIAAVLFIMTAAGLSACAETDISASVFGEWTRSSSGNGVLQTPSVHVGAMAEGRHIRNPLVGFDLNYSIWNASQYYQYNSIQHVHANANEFGGSWVFSLHVLNLRPFVLGGVGGTYFRPESGQPGTRSVTELTYAYGGGLDIALIPHFGLRLQYRGNLYKAPALLVGVPSTGVYTHTAQPMGGLFISF